MGAINRSQSLLNLCGVLIRLGKKKKREKGPALMSALLGFLFCAPHWEQAPAFWSPRWSLENEFLSWRVIQGHGPLCSSGIIFETQMQIFAPEVCLMSPRSGLPLFICPTCPGSQFSAWSSVFLFNLQCLVDTCSGPGQGSGGPWSLTASVPISFTASQSIRSRRQCTHLSVCPEMVGSPAVGA